MTTLWNDLRYAARGLARRRGFSLAVIATLALGIGANAAIFGIVDQLMLRPPAHVTDADQVTRILRTSQVPGVGTSSSGSHTYPDFVGLRDGLAGAAHVAAYNTGEMSLGRGVDARPVEGVAASHELFPLLGVRPALGRFFGPDDDRVGDAAPVVVLGHGFWQRRFAADPGVLGRELLLDGKHYTVIGVAPEGFTGADLSPVDVWVPLASQESPFPNMDWFTSRNVFWVEVIARVAPGVDREALAERATTLFRQANADDEGVSAERLTLAPLLRARGPDASEEARVALWLAAVAGLVLLIACANVANLLLIRGMHRQREIAVRLAVGVRRARLVRQLVTEALLLAVLGGALGLLLGHWGGRAIRGVLLPDLAAPDAMLEPRVLIFGAAATLLTVVLAGIAPAVQASRPDLLAALRTGTREGLPRRSRLKTALQVAQVALTLVLLAGAGLFLRSLRNATTLDIGMEIDRVLIAELSSTGGAREPAELNRLYQRMLERVQAEPGVEHAAIAFMIPFESLWQPAVRLPGRDSLPDELSPAMNAVTHDFFATMGITLLRGRGLTESDREGAAPVAVVNEAMARSLWPGEDAVGQCLLLGDEGSTECTTVVGVVETAHVNELGEDPTPQFFVPLTSSFARGPFRSLVIRTSVEPEAMVAPLRRTIQGTAPDLPYAEVRPFTQVLDPILRPWRLGATLFGVFGVLALVLALIGLYGVLSYTVAQRRHEIGVRVALGAGTAKVTSMVVRDGMRMALIGIGVGTVAALAGSRALASLLFGVSAADPATFVGAALLLLAAALLASWLPARRAARVEPMEALRAE